MRALEEHYKLMGADTNGQRRDEALKLSKKNGWMYENVERNANGKPVRACYG